jgi:alginate O-acetyltransferase complex protein AlgI
MLFNSYAFVFAFLPLALAIYHVLRWLGLDRVSISALTALSLFFYGWWNPVYLLLIIPLMLANFGLARFIVPQQNGCHPAGAKALLILGIAGNLLVLAYFKYANFFIDNINLLLGLDLFLAKVVLPLGISFFTFQKIAFLIDAYRGKVDKLNLPDFSLFVTFFPQLIAGPIVHHSEVLSQFRHRGGVPPAYITMGLTIFVIGLAKKVLFADTAAVFAAPGFAAAASGATVNLFVAWSSALAYTAQLYFDFSGYSDMAIGAALLFGIRLPVNFASPYKAASIIDFWYRWHITLSRFLRDYLYVTLGGSRHGQLRRYVNLLLTMLLGGLWHGAGWTFVVWGALHGLYLTINHGWRTVRPRLTWLPHEPGQIEHKLAHTLTFLAVVIGWVFFRATDITSALLMLKSMAGMNGLGATTPSEQGLWGLAVAGTLLLIAWYAPNTQQLTGYFGPKAAHSTEERVGAEGQTLWRPSVARAAAVGSLFGVAVLSLSRVSEFLYFQF